MSNLSPSPEMIEQLPEARFWGAMELRHWQGFWIERRALEDAVTFRSAFLARDDDVVLTSAMKTGTTWLKSICFSILRDRDGLATETPQLLVPSVVNSFSASKPPPFDPYDGSAPRLVHVHLPYSLLPDSVRDSACKIIYIARNPKDTVVSMWHFFNSVKGSFPLQKLVECFCSGVYLYGSFFDHVAEYWSESERRPEKILFVRYEELKSDPQGQIRRIAEFVGKPFGDGDKAEVEEIVRSCSMERLRKLEVNKNGTFKHEMPNHTFFRKGEVGDWKNCLTPEMEELIDRTSRTKLQPLGLSL